MSTRLAIASYIAAIVSAVIGAWAFFFPSQSERLDTKAGTSIAIPHKAPQVKGESSLAEKAAGETTAPSSENIKCNTRESIAKGVEIASTIHYTTERDHAFRTLVFQALCILDFQFAGQIASKIRYTQPRDSAFIEIALAAAKNKDFAAAHAAADRIHYTTPRDKTKHKILESMSSK